MPGQARQIDVGKALADRRGGGKRLLRRGELTLGSRQHGGQQHEISALDAVMAAFVQQPAGPRHPSAGAGAIALLREHERQPEAGASRADGIALREKRLEGAGQHRLAVRVSANQERRHRQTLKI